MKKGAMYLLLACIGLLYLMHGGVDVEKQAFVVSMGIDREDDGRTRVTLILPSASKPASGGSAGKGQSPPTPYELVTCDAENFMDALATLRATVPHELNFTQLSQVIVSEALARSAWFADTLESILTTSGIRQAAMLAVSRGSAAEFLKAESPFLDVRLSINLRTSEFVREQLGVIPDSQLGEVARAMRGAWRDVCVPYGAVSGEHAPETPPGTGQSLDVVAGEIMYDGSDKTELIGSALFRGGLMVDALTGAETQILSLIEGHTKPFMYYANGVYYRVEQTYPARAGVDMSSNPWKLTISGAVRAAPLRRDNANEDGLRDALTQSIFRLLLKLQAHGSDPIGFQGSAVRGVASLDNWSQARWAEAYENASLEVTISVTLQEAD